MNKYKINCSKSAQGSDRLYGLFFEDINYAADGGMNAELVQNNSFEYEYINYNEVGEPVDIRYDKLRFWSVLGDARVLDTDGMNANNPSYLEVNAKGRVVLSNVGYPMDGEYGMAVDCGEYSFSVYARNVGFKGEVCVYLVDKDGAVSDRKCFSPASAEFTKYCLKVEVAKRADANLVVEVVGEGVLHLDYFSLLPPDVFGSSDKWRNGRLKPSFVECLRQLKPGFIRFPGGCITEGDVDFCNMYEWKETVGELTARVQKANTWQYLQSVAVGFYEYFLLCEELGAAPLPVVHAGLICQIRTGMRGLGDVFMPHDSKEFYERVVENIAHLIYFARGSVDSADSEEAYWAAVRASMGHELPFQMDMIGIGNENWGDNYFTNFNAALEGLSSYVYKGKPTNLLTHFNIDVVTTVGVDVRPQDTNGSWQIISERYPNTIVDEHVYNSPQWFIDNAHRYDNYDRQGARVFMGEYAVHTDSNGRGSLNGVSNYRSALCEAAFLTGCERNSDVVKMTCYAPLFGKLGLHKWSPDLIWFNNRQIVRTPSYYVQQMFAKYYGSKILDVESDEVRSPIKGGIFIGSDRASVLVSAVRVVDADGKLLLSHCFKNGFGDFVVYPRCNGGTITEDGLLFDKSDGLNGYYLDADYGDCTLEVDFKKLSEGDCIIGLGVEGVVDSDVHDRDNFSLWLNYGDWGRVVYQKRFKYMLTANETIEVKSGDNIQGKVEIDGKTVELSCGTLRLCLSDFVLSASIGQNGCSVPLFAKRVFKTAETIFVSATADDDYVFVKLVNVGDGQQAELEVERVDGRAEVVSLYGDLEDINTVDRSISPIASLIDFDKVLTLNLMPNSVNVVKLKLK